MKNPLSSSKQNRVATWTERAMTRNEEEQVNWGDI